MLFIGGYRPFKYRRKGGPNAVSSPLIDAFALKAPRGFQIIVLSTPFRELAVPILKPLMIRLRGKVILKYIPLLSALPLIMREVAKAHVIHVFAGGEPLSVLIQLIAKILGKKSIVTFHGYDPIVSYFERRPLPYLARKLREIFYRISIELSTLVTFVSNFLRIEFKAAGLLDDKAPMHVVIHNGTDLKPMHQTKPKDKTIILSVIGGFPYCKGLDIMLKILERLTKRFQEHQIKLPIKVMIVGKVPEDLQQFLDRLAHYAIQVHVLHDIPHEKLLELYRQAHICVQLSRSESFLLPALEAASQGCAVVVSNRTGVAEALRNSAVIVDIKNEDQILNKLFKLIMDDKYREEIGHRCYEASKKYTYDKIALKYLRLYYILLLSSGKGLK